MSHTCSCFPGKPPPFNNILLETLEPSSTVAETATSPRATLPNFAAALTRHFEQPVKTTRSIPLPKLPALKRAAISQPPQHRRIQLYWPQVTSDSPPRVSGHASHSLLLLSSGHHHDLPENREPSPRASAAMNVGSIFDALSDPTELEVLSTLMNDSRLEEWFTKKPNEHANKKSKVKVTNNGTTTAAGTKRPSVLGPAASQKYHITVHCIKKSTDAGSGWEGFKRSMRHCRLTKSQINLLLETVPDRETAQGTRKLHEWEDHVTKVEELIKKCPTEPLYEDEEFVRYIASIPDLHQRLQCMLIMESFPDLMKRINADIEVLMDAMEVLLKSPGIRRFFHAILLLGNHQNEGTNLGNRKWFRIGTLKRVIDYRGAGREAKSLLSLIAMHLGPVMSREEAALITKAAHISIVQVVQSATQTYDIFKLLSEQSTETPPTPLVLVNSADDVTSSDDTTDHFASVGHRFIEQNRTQFQELRQDIRRLLEDYHCCVTYFGDPEAFLPLDKKVDDERNPGQKRYIQDIFSVFHELWVALRPALRDADTMGKVKRPMQKPVISEPSLQSTPKLTKASTSPAATSIGESFTVQQKLPLSSQSPVSTSSPPDISVEETSLFSVDALSSTITSSATLRDSADAVKEPPHATLASPVDLPAPRQVIEPLSSSSGECSISSCEHLPRISEKSDMTTPSSSRLPSACCTTLKYTELARGSLTASQTTAATYSTARRTVGLEMIMAPFNTHTYSTLSLSTPLSPKKLRPFSPNESTLPPIFYESPSSPVSCSRRSSSFFSTKSCSNTDIGRRAKTPLTTNNIVDLVSGSTTKRLNTAYNTDCCCRYLVPSVPSSIPVTPRSCCSSDSGYFTPCETAEQLQNVYYA